MHALDTYLHALHSSHASGGAVRKTSHYSALENLLNVTVKHRETAPRG